MPFDCETARRLIAKKLPSLITYARWASSVWSINVIMEELAKSWTDNKTLINVGFAAPWLLENIDSPEEWFGAILGLLEHEVAHILFSSTSKKMFEDYQEKARKAGIPYEMAMGLRAMLEDGRVNYSHANKSPQSIKPLQWVCELHYRYVAEQFAEDFQGQTEPQDILNDIMCGILQRARCGKDLPNLPESALEMLDKIDPLIETGIRASSTGEMIDKSAIPIGKILAEAFPMPPAEQDLGTGDNGEDELNGQGKKGGGKNDPRLNPRSNASQKEGGDGHEKPRKPSKPSSSQQANGNNNGKMQQNGENVSRQKQDHQSQFGEFLKKMSAEIHNEANEPEKQKTLPNAEEARNGLSAKVILEILNVHGVRFEERVAGYNQEGFLNAFQMAEPYIEPWIQEIKARLEHQRASLNHGVLNGRLDPKRMHRAVAFHDPRVFRANQRMNDYNIAAEILIDCSGSMDGEPMERAKTGAIVLTSGLNYLSIPNVVVGFTSYPIKDNENPDQFIWRVRHTRYTEWDNPDIERIGAMEADECNRDGYSIRVAKLELEQRHERKKLLFVLSDGLPNYWSLEEGIEDTAKAVEEVREAGVKVVALYFGPTEPEFIEQVHKIYGDQVIVVRELNTLITEMIDIMDDELNK